MNIAIIGLGLIGGSFAKAFKFYTNNKVFGYDIDNKTIEKAISCGAIDGIATDETVKSCDLVLISLYPSATVKYVTDNCKNFNENTLVIDCCGVKECVCTPCFELSKQYNFIFLGGHPMAGVHFSGFDYTAENLFNNASMIIVPKENEQSSVLDKVNQIFLSVGFKNITLTTAEEHDRIIAYTSQLAHVASNAYVKSPSSLMHKGFSAGSYKDLTRVAYLNENMWTELFMDNKKALLYELTTYINELTKYRNALENDNYNELKNLLRDGRIIKEKVDLEEK